MSGYARQIGRDKLCIEVWHKKPYKTLEARVSGPIASGCSLLPCERYLSSTMPAKSSRNQTAGLLPSCPPHRSPGLDVLFLNCHPKKKPQGRSKEAEEVKSRVKKSGNRGWNGIFERFFEIRGLY